MECLVYNHTASGIMTKTRIRKIVKEVLCKLGKCGCELSVSLVGDKRMKKLNLIYLGKNKVTDVLSFSALEGYVGPSSLELGDIVICVPQVRRQAKRNDVKATKEFSLMLIHGLLHLLGFDHIELKEAKKMFSLQEKILRGL